MSGRSAIVVGVGAEYGLGAALCRRFAQSQRMKSLLPVSPLPGTRYCWNTRNLRILTATNRFNLDYPVNADTHYM